LRCLEVEATQEEAGQAKAMVEETPAEVEATPVEAVEPTKQKQDA